MLIALIGVVSHIGGYLYGWCVLGFGAMLMLIVRLIWHARIGNKTTRRQILILMFGALMLLSATYLIYIGRRYWVIPIIIDAIVELYVSFRLKDDKLKY